MGPYLTLVPLIAMATLRALAVQRSDADRSGAPLSPRSVALLGGGVIVYVVGEILYLLKQGTSHALSYGLLAIGTCTIALGTVDAVQYRTRV